MKKKSLQMHKKDSNADTAAVTEESVTASTSYSVYLLLWTVAVLYGTLNVTLRAVYALPGPPTASVLSTARGWMAVLCFGPFFVWKHCATQTSNTNTIELSPMMYHHHHRRRRRRRDHRQYDTLPQTSANPQRDTWDSLVLDTEGNDKEGDMRGVLSENPSTASPKKELQPPPLQTRTFMLVWVAFELALWNFGAQALINTGLRTIASAARAAFETQLSVVFTPLLSIALGRPAPRRVWYACFSALVGLTLLTVTTRATKTKDDGATAVNDDDDYIMTTTTVPGSSLNHAVSFGVADVLCLAGAMSWSMYLFRLSAVGANYSEVNLQALKTLFLAILYSVWCGVAWFRSQQDEAESSPWPGWNNGILAWVLLLYSAAGPGTIADLMQQKAQATISASIANVILSLEPVFTAFLGRLLMDEETSQLEKLGGAFILTAAVVATRE
eukprot:scaffold24048_cov194-Amphora_coffeaeformis.AAC.16